MSRQLYLDNNCNVANSGSCCVVRVDDEPLVWCPGRHRSLEEGFVCLPQVLFGTLLVEPGCEVGHPRPTTVNSTTCPQIFKIFPARMLLRTFQYPSHSNKLKPEAQQTTVRKVKSRAQQVPNCTRSNCPGEPSPLIPPKVQSSASSPESGYLLVCPFFSVRSCMEYIPLRHGVTPAAQTPEHAERGTAVDVPLPSSPRAIALQGFHREILPESTKHRSQQVWMWKASTWRAGYGWEFLHHYEFVACCCCRLCLLAAPSAMHHDSPQPTTTTMQLLSPVFQFHIPCAKWPSACLTVSDLLLSVNLMQDRVATTKLASSHHCLACPSRSR
ncbi:hypothetical protein CMEL01_05287 [Colletotrichum melonis]|uniref:Uncharacterized protein n=1 Tax=Colletotrichum melonis TaxID=1209925 RepID=A0AAI9XKH7_9PEZI|nr:hypothetical protein CMEL01_05287 [Colletotrichum melonis]